MGFFDLTKEDLEDGKAKFNGGDTATMHIASIVKKEINNSQKVIVECVVLSGANVGLKHSLWFAIDSTGGRKGLGIFVTTFMTAQEAADCPDPTVLINRKFSCDFVATTSGDRVYVNERNYKEVSDVPVIPTMEPVAQPVQQPAQQVQQQVQPVQQAVQQPATIQTIADNAQALGVLSKSIF